MSEHPRDDELLKEFLAGESELSRRYRETSAENPPAHIDAAIIASARWAVGADRKGADRKGADQELADKPVADRTAVDQAGVDKNRSDRTSSDQASVDERSADGKVGGETMQSGFADKIAAWQRSVLAHWRIPLATAAVVVIAATLTLMIERNPPSDRIGEPDDTSAVTELAQNESDSSEPARTAMSEQQSQVTGKVPEPAKAEPAAPARSAPEKQVAKTAPEPAKTEAAKRQAASESTTKQTSTKPVAPTSPAPASATEQSGKGVGADSVARRKEELAATSVVAREAAEPKSQAAEPSSSATVQESAPSISAEVDGETAAGRDTDAGDASYAGAPFPNAGNVSASSGERRDQPSASADAGMPAETQQTASAQTESEGEQALAAASDETAKPGSADTRDPQQWIKDINDLLAQGERTRAIDSLKQFRRKFPDYQLTPELQALLPADSR